ncbi:hypothetical protein BY996DRAFT_6411169 [Phakopsora pachyrhizi]|uniref:Uncharacterized protein n=1 Tax=Phakopsora pachyrhizi TaxID=170000 RepID=A0AAV0BNY6_PHAPC|nr:hypothetical protein BY996DRAFT_6411169 [Phakopsora pachyrhizi]CAH7687920.1 hypothetical protein PPACK8108_LOCUS22784 [Phakopsora pachyrhizi]
MDNQNERSIPISDPQQQHQEQQPSDKLLTLNFDPELPISSDLSIDPTRLLNQINELEKHVQESFLSIGSILRFNLQTKRLKISDFLDSKLPPRSLNSQFKWNVRMVDKTLSEMENITEFAKSIVVRDLKRAREREAAAQRLEQDTQQKTSEMQVSTTTEEATDYVSAGPKDADTAMKDQNVQQLVIDLTTLDSSSMMDRPKEPVNGNILIPESLEEPRSPSIELQVSPKRPEQATLTENPENPSSSPEIEIEPISKVATKTSDQISGLELSSKDFAPLNSLDPKPMEVVQRPSVEAIEGAGGATTTKSGSDDTDEDLGSLFGSSSNGSAGPSPTLDGPTDSNDKAESVPQTEAASSPEKPLASAGLPPEVSNSGKAQDETSLGKGLDDNNQSAARDEAAGVGSTVTGDGGLSTSLSELEPPADLTEFLSNFMAAHATNQSSSTDQSLSDQQQQQQQIGSFGNLGIGNDDNQQTLGSQLNQLISSLSSDQTKTPINHNDGHQQQQQQQDLLTTTIRSDGIGDVEINELEEISKFLSPSNNI